MRQSLRTVRYSHAAGRLMQASLLAAIFGAGSGLVWAGEGAELRLSPSQLAFSVPLVLNLTRTPESVSVELDGYDVSAFAMPTADSLQMALQLPLATGNHQLVVLANYPDGSIETLLTQPLVVAANSLISSENWSANVSLDSSYLAVKHQESDFTGVSSVNSNGAAVIRGAHTDGDWQVETLIDTLYDDNAQNSGTQDQLNLPNYLLAVSRQSTLGASRMQVGDALVGDEGLVFSSYRRRGVSFKHETRERMLEAEAFALQTEPTTSASDNVIYPSDTEERAVGTHMVIRPLQGDSQSRLQLRTSYLTGTSTATGTGFYDPDSIESGGHVSSAGVLSEWLAGSLAVEAEYANSSFDFDGEDQGAGAENDNATRYAGRLSSGALIPSGLLDQWTLQLTKSTVGRYFYTLGNRTLPGDLDTDRAEFAGSVAGFSFFADTAQATNNVDSDITVADFQYDTAGLTVYYTPTTIVADTGIWHWLGVPTFDAGIRTTDQVQDRNDASLVGYDINNQTDELMGGVSFGHSAWRWYLQQARIEVDDSALPVMSNGVQIFTPNPDSSSDQTTLQVAYSPTPWLYIAPLAQYNRVTESDTGRRYTTSRFGIDTQFHLIRDVLVFSLNYSEDRNQQTYNSPLYQNGDTLFRSGSGQLLWKAVPAKGIRPGVDLYTKGSIGYFDDRNASTANIDNEIWQLMLGANVYLAK